MAPNPFPRGREEGPRATCIPPTWFPRWSARILARILLVCPIAFPQFGRMGWPFSGVSTGTSGQAKGPGRSEPECLAPIASPRGRGKKDRARHVFGQHGFHAGPRASLPAVSLCVPSRSLNLDGWGGPLAECLQGQAGKQRGPDMATQSASRPSPPPEGEGRRITRDMYSANMGSTLVRGHPCPMCPN